MSDDPTAPPAIDASDTPAPARGPDALIGKIINNNYRIDRLIGVGGMGEVFAGEHLFTGNKVAIKMVLQGLSRDEKIVSLFKREARILFKLTDDAIARYLDSVYDTALDRYCLIMDFIDGIPLGDLVVERGPLNADEARRLIRRLAAGLEKAHQLEVTHRDLSPDNVMLREGSVDQAVLIDFGIARSTQMGDATLHGQFAGKFKYVSPEQLGHFDGVIGPRTDVYGLALLVAMAVRGSPIDMGGSIVEAVNARRTIPALTGVPGVLQPLLAHMLEPDPEARPARMLDVVRMVDDPGLIPARYRSITAVPGQGESDAPGLPPETLAPGSLAPGSRPPGSAPRAVTAPAEATVIAMPPGAVLQGSAPRPFEGLSVAPAPLLPPVPEKKRQSWPLIAVVAALAAGGGGWYLTQTPAPPPAEAAVEPPPAAEAAASLPAPDVTTRDGFLAAFGTDQPCTYATRITAGANAGKLERFGQASGSLGDLAQAYGRAFGVAPATVERVVASGQCAALELARGLQGRAAVQPVLVIDTDAVRSGGTILGRITDTRGRTVWLFLVTPTGAMFNLSSRLEPQPDGSQIFGFGMAQAAAGSGPEPQLLMVVASDAPLASAAAAADGALAATVLPLVLAEVAQQSGRAAAQIAFFSLAP